jgi:hypothetical protein
MNGEVVIIVEERLGGDENPVVVSGEKNTEFGKPSQVRR